MGVSGSGEAIGRILGRPPRSHPYAYGSFGFWVVQRKPAPPLGWVLARSDHGVYVMHCYAYGQVDLATGNDLFIAAEAPLRTRVKFLTPKDASRIDWDSVSASAERLRKATSKA